MAFEVGEKAMLISHTGFDRRLIAKPVVVEKVYKNGQVVLKGVEQRYRQDGSPTGKSGGFHDARPRLRKWCDNLFQQAKNEASQAKMASNLYCLSKKLEIASMDRETASEIWEALPFSIREIIEENPQ